MGPLIYSLRNRFFRFLNINKRIIMHLACTGGLLSFTFLSLLFIQQCNCIFMPVVKLIRIGVIILQGVPRPELG